MHPRLHLVPFDALMGRCVGDGHKLVLMPAVRDKPNVCVTHGGLPEEVDTVLYATRSQSVWWCFLVCRDVGHTIVQSVKLLLVLGEAREVVV